MQIMIRVGNRFNKIAIHALLTLMVTGFYSSRVLLTNPDFLFGTSYGNFLITKIFLMTALAVTYFVHVRVIRKDVEDKIMSGQMSEHQIQTLRKKIIILGQITVLLSFVILFLQHYLMLGYDGRRALGAHYLSLQDPPGSAAETAADRHHQQR